MSRYEINAKIKLAEQKVSSENKYYETGSSPYYLNINNTAKDYSENETSCPQNELIDLLYRHTIILDEDIEVEDSIIEEPIFAEEE